MLFTFINIIIPLGKIQFVRFLLDLENQTLMSDGVTHDDDF